MHVSGICRYRASYRICETLVHAVADEHNPIRASDNSIAYWWRTEILAMHSPPVGFHDGERQSVRQPIRWPLQPRCYILRTVSQPARPIYGLPKCETRTATTARHTNLLILEANGFPLTVEALVFCMYEMAGQPQAIHWLFGIPA